MFIDASLPLLGRTSTTTTLWMTNLDDLHPSQPVTIDPSFLELQRERLLLSTISRANTLPLYFRIQRSKNDVPEAHHVRLLAGSVSVKSIRLYILQSMPPFELWRHTLASYDFHFFQPTRRQARYKVDCRPRFAAHSINVEAVVPGKARRSYQPWR